MMQKRYQFDSTFVQYIEYRQTSFLVERLEFLT